MNVMRPQSLPWEVFSAWRSAFLFRNENSGSVIQELAEALIASRVASASSSKGYPNNFNGPPGGHLYGVLRVWREPKQSTQTLISRATKTYSQTL
jgi:hypothetical protein